MNAPFMNSVSADLGQAAASRARWGWLSRPPDRMTVLAVNLAGAAFAAQFARASLAYYVHTHRLIGAAFLVEQGWFVIAFLIRRPPSDVSRHPGSWLLAAAGTFGGLLFRPSGAHLAWGVHVGFALQLAGLVIAIGSLAALGRSFGFVAANRGLVTRGPYAIVRHPVYAAYLVIQTGYLLQAISPRNAAVLVLVTGCNIGRALTEERILSRSPGYTAYRQRVGGRLLPGIW